MVHFLCTVHFYDSSNFQLVAISLEAGFVRMSATTSQKQEFLCSVFESRTDLNYFTLAKLEGSFFEPKPPLSNFSRNKAFCAHRGHFRIFSVLCDLQTTFQRIIENDFRKIFRIFWFFEVFRKGKL